MPKVTLVIPSWDAAKLLEATLPSALAQTGVDYEIIVVDNGSPGRDTLALVDRLAARHPGKIRALSLPTQAGYTGAVNAGVDAATTALVAVLGNDNMVPENWLSSLVALYETGTSNASGRKIGAVMSQTIVGGETPPGPCTLNHFGRNVFYRDETWGRRAIATFYPGGNAFLFDKTIFGRPFEDFYFAYHEDVALGWRVRLRGLEVLESPTPRVASFDGGSTKRSSVRFRSLMLTERNRLLNLLTFPEWHTLARLAPLLLLDCLGTLLLGKTRRAKFSAWAWIAVNPGAIASLRQRRQAERQAPDREALRELSWLYFSTATPAAGAKALAKWIANLAVFAYMRILFIPGRWHG